MNVPLCVKWREHVQIQSCVETERKTKAKLVKIVLQTLVSVNLPAETAQSINEKLVSLVRKTYDDVNLNYVEMEKKTQERHVKPVLLISVSAKIYVEMAKKMREKHVSTVLPM